MFIVIADVEPTPPVGSGSVDPLEVTNTPITAAAATPQQPILVSSDLLSPPLTTSITRQRVCKSVSDATDRQRPIPAGRSSVKKSTSDTCIKQTKDMSTSCSDLVTEHGVKKTHEKSIRKKILNRLFSKTKQIKSTSSKSSSRSSQQDVQRQIDDDISDSGMVSGFSGLHESPSPGKLREDTTHHSFSGYDAKTRKAYTLDRGEDSKGHKTLALSRSSSDPSLSQSQQHSSKRPMKRHKVTRSKKQQGHERSKRSRDHEQKDYYSGQAAVSNIRRTKSMKAGRYPSVEKLDRMRVGSDASALKKRVTRKVPTVGPSHGNRENNHKTDIHTSTVNIEQLKVFHYSEIKYLADRKLCRSISDPSLTFKRIEEKVLQRSATKKWQRHKRDNRRHVIPRTRFQHSNQPSSQHSSSQASSSGNYTAQNNNNTFGPITSTSTNASNKQQHQQPAAIATVNLDESLPVCQSNLSLDHQPVAKQPQHEPLSAGDNPMSQSALSLHRLSVESCTASFDQLGRGVSSGFCHSGLSLNHLHTARQDVGNNNNDLNLLTPSSMDGQVT